MLEKQKPGIGIGVIVVNDEAQILVMKRKNSHAPFWSIAGGGLELGETFEEAAIREMKEEANLDIVDPKVFCVTNNLKTYANEGVHFVSVGLVTHTFSGELRIMEPEKCEEWRWVNPEELPQPHFDASEMAVELYREQLFYKQFSHQD